MSFAPTTLMEELIHPGPTEATTVTARATFEHLFSVSKRHGRVMLPERVGRKEGSNAK